MRLEHRGLVLDPASGGPQDHQEAHRGILESVDRSEGAVLVGETPDRAVVDHRQRDT